MATEGSKPAYRDTSTALVFCLDEAAEFYDRLKEAVQNGMQTGQLNSVFYSHPSTTASRRTRAGGRRLNAFNVFVAQRMHELEEQGWKPPPGTTVTGSQAMLQEIAREWREMTPEQRRAFKAKVEAEEEARSRTVDWRELGLTEKDMEGIHDEEEPAAGKQEEGGDDEEPASPTTKQKRKREKAAAMAAAAAAAGHQAPDDGDAQDAGGALGDKKKKKKKKGKDIDEA